MLELLASEVLAIGSEPLVVAASLMSGAYAPRAATKSLQLPQGKLYKAAAEVAALVRPVGEAAAASPEFVLVAKFVEQLFKVDGAILEAWEAMPHETPDQVSTPDALERLIRAAASRGKRLVWLPDDLDRAHEAAIWTSLIDMLAPAIVRDLPILLIASLDGPVELGEHEPGEPEVLYLARALRRGWADWWTVESLNQEPSRTGWGSTTTCRRR